MADNQAENPGCLGRVLAIFGIKPVEKEDSTGEVELFPYTARELLSPAEISFYGVLRQCLGPKNVILAKIRLADLIEVEVGTDKRQTYFNKISRKHIDFVICSGKNLAPKLLVELDDKSHERKKTQDRDRFVELALSAAGLKLMRVKAKRSYSVNEVKHQLRETLA